MQVRAGAHTAGASSTAATPVSNAMYAVFVGEWGGRRTARVISYEKNEASYARRYAAAQAASAGAVANGTAANGNVC